MQTLEGKIVQLLTFQTRNKVATQHTKEKPHVCEMIVYTFPMRVTFFLCTLIECHLTIT